MKNATIPVNTIISKESEFEAKKTAYFNAIRDGQIFDALTSTYIETNTIESPDWEPQAINFPIVEVSRHMLGRM